MSTNLVTKSDCCNCNAFHPCNQISSMQLLYGRTWYGKKEMRRRKGERIIKTHLTNTRQDTRHSFSQLNNNLTGKSAPRDKTLYRSEQRKPLKTVISTFKERSCRRWILRWKGTVSAAPWSSPPRPFLLKMCTKFPSKSLRNCAVWRSKMAKILNA